MTEKVLPYDRSVVGQETGYWCGPAATQVVLNSRGVIVPEPTLAAEIGTTTRGTDYVGLIERILDRRVPDANYTSVYTERDPMSSAQKDTLWAHIVQSINAGFGVVMNWVAPPSNKPRGVKGSQSPRYSGGTTYHYVAAMGYDDVERAVWIADSGFQPQGYWISFDQCATLIPPKGYCYANVGSVVSPPAAGGAEVLARSTGLTVARAGEILAAVVAGLEASACTNPNRIAMWLAQVGHESAGFNATEEYASGAAYEGRADLGNTQPGDGVRFKGRSWIQITGRHNYGEFSKWAFGKSLVPSPTEFVDNPNKLAELRWAGVGAAWYWTVSRPDINALSDQRDLETVTRRINGGLNGLEDRRNRYNRASALGGELLQILNGGDDLASVPQDQWDRVYRELTQKLASRSLYATPGENGIDTLAGFALNVDKMEHEKLVEKLAVEYGDDDAIFRIARVAGGQGRDTSAWAVGYAKKVLAKIPAEFLTAFQERRAA